MLATCALFTINAEVATAEVGYRVAPEDRGRGVARSVVNAVARWSFAEYALARIELAHSTRPPSCGADLGPPSTAPARPTSTRAHGVTVRG